MKRLAILPIGALALLLPAFAFAQGGGSIQGRVIEHGSGKPLYGVAVNIDQLPLRSADTARMHTALSDRHGFFASIGLEPGAYLVSASVRGHTSSCVVRYVYSGLVRHITIVIARGNRPPKCEGPYSGAYDPDQTSDTTILH